MSAFAESNTQIEVYQISVSNIYSCALTNKGVICWGNKGRGEIYTPRDLTNVSQISVGTYHRCANTEHGVRCWDDAGRDTQSDLPVPKDLGRVSQISSGYYQSCAISDKGLKCWGYSNYAKMKPPSDLGEVYQVSIGGSHTHEVVCAVASRGLRCWGDNNYEQLTLPSDLGVVYQVSVGDFHVCAVTDRGLRCWGMLEGRKYQIKDIKKMSQLSAGHNNTCAFVNQEVQCWGYALSSLDLEPGEEILQISNGGLHVCALTTKKIECWGDNRFGQVDIPLELSSHVKTKLQNNDGSRKNFESMTLKELYHYTQNYSHFNQQSIQDARTVYMEKLKDSISHTLTNFSTLVSIKEKELSFENTLSEYSKVKMLLKFQSPETKINPELVNVFVDFIGRFKDFSHHYLQYRLRFSGFETIEFTKLFGAIETQDNIKDFQEELLQEVNLRVKNLEKLPEFQRGYLLFLEIIKIYSRHSGLIPNLLVDTRSMTIINDYESRPNLKMDELLGPKEQKQYRELHDPTKQGQEALHVARQLMLYVELRRNLNALNIKDMY